MFEILLEIAIIFVIAFMLLCLWRQRKYHLTSSKSALNTILAGFSLLLFGSILALMDNFESLNSLIIVGKTPAEAILEKMVGFLGGFTLLSIGLIRWLTEIKLLSDNAANHHKTEQLLVISQQNQADASIMLQTVLDAIPVRVFWKDAALNYLGSNELFAHDAGLNSPKELIGKSDFDMPWKNTEAEAYRTDDQSVIHSGRAKLNIEEQQLTAKGEEQWVLTNKVPLINSSGKTFGVLGTYHDISERKRQQKILRNLAYYDSLTHLPNRILFADRFKLAVAHSDRTGSMLAICFLDLDDFKPINDNYGHDIGDKLLLEVAKRLKAIIREGDTVSRQGGDEFAILLGGIESPEQCKQVLDRICNSLAQTYLIDGRSHQISASIGATIYPTDKADLDTLLHHADKAMYKAKLLGKNQLHIASGDNQ